MQITLSSTHCMDELLVTLSRVDLLKTFNRFTGFNSWKQQQVITAHHLPSDQKHYTKWAYCRTRDVRNPMKILDIGFLKTELNQTDFKIKKTEDSVSAVQFSKNRLWRFGYSFSCCLIHNSPCSMIGSTVTAFFFVPYLCIFSSESLRLTINWTNSARNYVISSVIHVKQHTVQTNQKTETAVNLTRKPSWR